MHPVIKNFAQSLEQKIGSDETVSFLEFLTDVINQNPDFVEQLRVEAVTNPEGMKSLLSRESLQMFDSIIKSGGAGLFSF